MNELFLRQTLFLLLVLAAISACVSGDGKSETYVAPVLGTLKQVQERVQSVCCSLRSVCIDQGVFVLYHASDDATRGGKLPECNVESEYPTDLYGVSDVWGTQWAAPRPVLRPHTAGEETPELRNPTFSNATVPVVVYTMYVRVYGEFLSRVVTNLFLGVNASILSRESPVVLQTDTMQPEPWMQRLVQPFTTKPLVSLSHLSSRLPYDTPENYTHEGKHVRCFERLWLCNFAYKKGGVLDGIMTQPCHALVQHYQQQLPAVPGVLKEPGVLRVLIVTRKRTSIRNILNKRELHDWCNAYQPPAGGPVQYARVHCVMRDVGKSFLMDMALSQHSDIVLGLHGSGLYNAFFMPRGGSLVEVRPYEFGRMGWADSYFRQDIKEDDYNIFWWGINVENKTNWQPGLMEHKNQGAGSVWSRDRNTRLEPAALKYVFDRIVLCGKDRGRYLEYVRLNETFITDTLHKVPEKPEDRGPREPPGPPPPAPTPTAPK